MQQAKVEAGIKETETKDPEKKINDLALKAGKSDSNKKKELDICWS